MNGGRENGDGVDEDFETLRVERREDRTVVELYRPEARNAINARMIAELHRVCAELEEDPRPLLLTGHGAALGAAKIAMGLPAFAVLAYLVWLMHRGLLTRRGLR